GPFDQHGVAFGFCDGHISRGAHSGRLSPHARNDSRSCSRRCSPEGPHIRHQ
ncbi:hypothetical protein FOZ63_006488, partial [Perkinsus olseni]